VADTWWILDTGFPVLYAVLLGFAVFVAGRACWLATGGKPKSANRRPAEAADLRPYEVAVLNGNEASAVIIALAKLHQAG